MDSRSIFSLEQINSFLFTRPLDLSGSFFMASDSVGANDTGYQADNDLGNAELLQDEYDSSSDEMCLEAGSRPSWMGPLASDEPVFSSKHKRKRLSKKQPVEIRKRRLAYKQQEPLVPMLVPTLLNTA